MSPHSEYPAANGSTTMTTTSSDTGPTTNGDKPYSLFIAHLQSYPLISEPLDQASTTPVVTTSISLLQPPYQFTTQLLTPLAPYFSHYLGPSLARIDRLGDKSLSRLDSQVPSLRDTTPADVSEKVKTLLGLPLVYAKQGKDYVVGVYGDEYENSTGSYTIVKTVKATLGTELRVAGKCIDEATGVVVAARKWTEGLIDALLEGYRTKKSEFNEEVAEMKESMTEKKD